MDISADVEQIIAKAPNWNIEGDVALLELMKRISQVSGYMNYLSTYKLLSLFSKEFERKG